MKVIALYEVGVAGCWELIRAYTAHDAVAQWCKRHNTIVIPLRLQITLYNY